MTTPVEKYEELRHRRDTARKEAKEMRFLNDEAKNGYARVTIGHHSLPVALVQRISDALAGWADDEEKVVADLEQQMTDLFKPTRPEEVSETAPSVLGTR